MRGSIRWQVHEVFHRSGILRFGHSKHTAKDVARQGGARTHSDLGRSIGVFSYNTANKYMDICEDAGCFAKECFGVLDLQFLRPEHVRAYLEECIDAGLALATYQQRAAALAKFEQALNLFAEVRRTGFRYDFREAIEATREAAKRELEPFEGSRAYERAGELIEAVGDPTHRLGARLQYEGAPRVHEISLIRAEQLQGLSEDPYTGRLRGYLEVKGKGGKVYRVSFSPLTYELLRENISRNGEFRLDKDEYRRSLKRAARATDQEYSGSHGLRWNYAQWRFRELTEAGLSYEEAMSVVSKEMGHERADITGHYLR